MELREFEILHKKVETLKEKSMKAQGSLDALKEECNKKYSTSDIDDLVLLKKKNDKLIEENITKIDEQFTELKGLTNWNLV